MALTAYITTAGQAAIADAQIYGYKIDLVRFKLGNTLITETDPAVIRTYSTLPGSIVLDSGNNPTDGSLTAQISDSGVVVKIYLSAAVGDFTLGSAGLYLSDGTLFAVLKLTESYTKTKNSGSIVGNTIAFPFVFAITVQEVLNLSILAESVATLPVVTTEADLPAYDIAPYSNYFVQEYASSGRSAIACRFATEWQFCLASQQDLFEGWIQVASSGFDSGIINGDAVYYNASTAMWSLLDGLGAEQSSVGIRQGNGVRVNSFFYKDNFYLAGTKYYVDSYPSLGKLTTLETNYYVGTAITSSILPINPSYIGNTIIPNTEAFQSYQAAVNGSSVYILTNDTGEYPETYYDGQVIQFVAPLASIINQKIQLGSLPSVYIMQGGAGSSGVLLDSAAIIPAGSLVTLTYLNVDGGFRLGLRRTVLFKAGPATNQTIAASTATKVVLGTEIYDTHGYFSPSTSRFTPLIAGYYQFNAACYVSLVTGASVRALLYVNGVQVGGGSFVVGPNYAQDATSILSNLIYMNGSSDYAELYVIQYSTDGSETLTATVTYFSAFLIS